MTQEQTPSAPDLFPEMTGRQFAFRSALVFLVINLALFGSSFFSEGKILSGHDTDTVTQIVPWFTFEAREFSKGHLPLWNPYSFCGTPFVANLSSACFYP